MEGQIEDDPRSYCESSETRLQYFQIIPSFDGWLPWDLYEMDVTGTTERKNRATSPWHIWVSNLETRRKTRRDNREWKSSGLVSLQGKRRLEVGRSGYGMAGWFGELRPGHGPRGFWAVRQSPWPSPLIHFWDVGLISATASSNFRMRRQSSGKEPELKTWSATPYCCYLARIQSSLEVADLQTQLGCNKA